MAMGKSVVNKGLIGKGAFGCVYLVENSEGEQFAVKVMEWQHARPAERGVVENELKVLKELAHEHVICYTDHFLDKGLMYVITEYCGGGDLSGFLDQAGRPLPEDLLRLWLWQMACGLEYMHTHESGPVLHRDLKPGNVFLSETGNVRLGDVGISRILDRPDAMAETFCGTPPYMSPEALREEPYNSKTDLWSLGCCVVEMATLERAYDGSTLLILRDAVQKRRRPLPHEYSRELDDLLSTMLLLNFQDRASASNVLDNPILDGCEDAKPMDLLVKHSLQNALAMHRRASPSSTRATSRPPTRFKADEKVLTLTDSIANLKVILDEGEPITSYRVKVEGRMRGRRPDDSTLTSSTAESLKTVLYKSEATKVRKSTGKTLKVPKSGEKKDDSLCRPVLSSMTDVVGRACGEKMAPQSRSAGTSQAASDQASGSTQTELLRALLSKSMGSEALSQASTLVNSTASRQELREGLSTLMGDYQLLLSDIVIYLLLKESVQQSTTSDI